MKNMERLPRRDFIKLSGAGIASLAGISACSGARRGDSAESGSDTLLKSRLGEKRYALLYYASLAPSPHNTQPWYVRITDENRWVVGADRTRRMATTDPENHRLILSIGSFIENMSLAAGALGFNADVRPVSDDFSGEDIAMIVLRDSEAAPYPLERIVMRKTVKNGYRDRIPGDDHLQILAEPLEGHFHFFPRGSWHSNCIRDGAIEAFRAWLDSRNAQAEHVRWLRIGNREAMEERDGLTTEGMEIKGITGWIVRTFISDDEFAGTFMKNESMKFVRRTAAEGGGYAIVTGYGRTVAGMLELGRRYQRMALLARELGIGIQPMTQMLEMESGRGFIGANHHAGIDPQMILRIGYVENYPAPVTLRRSPGSFVQYA